MSLPAEQIGARWRDSAASGWKEVPLEKNKQERPPIAARVRTSAWHGRRGGGSTPSTSVDAPFPATFALTQQ